MSKISYKMQSVTEKRVVEKSSRSIFDPIIDEFIKGDFPLVEVRVENRKDSYMKSSVIKRLDKRGIENIEVSLGYDCIYLEKKTPT